VRAAYDERIAAGLVPMGRWGRPEDVGRAVALIAAGDLPYSTGAVIGVDGGLGLRILCSDPSPGTSPLGGIGLRSALPSEWDGSTISGPGDFEGCHGPHFPQ